MQSELGKSSRYYVGQTTDIDKRLKRHNQGHVPSTKYGIPWKLVLQLEVSNKTEALILERKIKKRGAKRYIDDYLGVYHAKAWQVSLGYRATFGTWRPSRRGVTTQTTKI